MNTVTHSIIAGVPKAATTSLFRYLSDHPDICPSRIKETNYLSRPISDIARAKDEYSRFFNKEKGNHRVLLEASPGYFLNARTFCQNYGELVENGKVIVVLREPIDLLKSFFKHRVNKTNELNPRTSFTAFLTAVIDEDTQSAVFSNNCVSKEEIIAQKKNGLYFDYLQIFYDMLGKKNLKIIFFEELIEHPHRTLTDVCDFLAIEIDFYEEYRFRVENKNREYRSVHIHRIIHPLIMSMEPVLNRMPFLRRCLRSLYLYFNDKKIYDADNLKMEDETRAELKAYYSENILALKHWLEKEYPEINHPQWLAKW